MGVLRVIYALLIFEYHTAILNHILLFHGVRLMSASKTIYSFYIVSGFYMAYILNKKYVGSKYSYYLFLSNRFLRIYPMYWLLLLMAIVFSLVPLLFGVITPDFAAFMQYYIYLYHYNLPYLPLVITADIITNTTLLIRSSYVNTIYASSHSFPSMGFSWTLISELLFYTIAPFLVRKKGMMRFVMIGIVALISYLFFHYEWIDYQLTSYMWIHSLVFFMLGYLSFIIFDSFAFSKLPRMWLFVIAVAIWVFTLGYYSLPIPILQWKWMVFNDWIYYSVLVAAIPFVFQFTRVFAWDNLVADYSYPIYLSHMFLNYLIVYFHLVKPDTQYFVLVSLVLTIIFSTLIIVFIERPLNKFRQGRIVSSKGNLKRVAPRH